MIRYAPQRLHSTIGYITPHQARVRCRQRLDLAAQYESVGPKGVTSQARWSLRCRSWVGFIPSSRAPHGGEAAHRSADSARILPDAGSGWSGVSTQLRAAK